MQVTARFGVIYRKCPGQLYWIDSIWSFWRLPFSLSRGCQIKLSQYINNT